MILFNKIEKYFLLQGMHAPDKKMTNITITKFRHIS